MDVGVHELQHHDGRFLATSRRLPIWRGETGRWSHQINTNGCPNGTMVDMEFLSAEPVQLRDFYSLRIYCDSAHLTGAPTAPAQLAQEEC